MAEARGWLPDDVAIIPAGLDLAAAVASVDRAALSDDDLIRLAQARQRLVAHVEAQLLADLHAIGRRADKLLCKDEVDRHEWAETEIGFALTWTRTRAGGQLVFADNLLDRLPAVFAALDAGVIDVPKAMVFDDETINLDREVARRVADQLLGQAHTLTTGQLRVRLRKLVLAADPDAVRKAAKERVKGRRVEARLTVDGLAELCGYDLPPHRVAAAAERLTAAARAAKAAGDTRRMDQLRADAMLDLLVGDGLATGGPITAATIGTPDPEQSESEPQPAPAPDPEVGDDAVDPDDEELAPLWAAGFDQLPTTRPGECPTCGRPTVKGAMPGPRRGVVDIQVPLTTLIGLTDFPGELAGYGPVIADIARQVVADQTDATWRCSVYDEQGRLIHHGHTRRRPKAADVAFIRARDRTCRAPGCRRPAGQCDVDHSQDWAKGGSSCRCNLACLCRLHHLLKHLEHSGLIQLDHGVLAFRTPLGQHLTTHPEAYVDELRLALLDSS
jgi:Domain of unknown function (DUF222)